MNKKLIIAISIASTFLFSQEITNIPDVVTKVGTAAGNWLKLETNIRALGMGGANVASGMGVASIPINPANIAYLTGSETYYLKSNYIADITHNVIAYGTRLSSTDYMAFNLFYLDSGPIGVTTETFPDGTGEDYHVRAFSVGGTYARVLTDRLKVGLTVKYVRENIHTTHMQSFAFDLGSNFRTGIYGFTLGMCVSNFGPEIQFHGDGLNTQVDEDVDVQERLDKITEKFPLPLSFRLGIKNDLIGKDSEWMSSETNRLTFAMDGVNPIDFSVQGGAGLEYAWKEIAFVRAGTHFNHDTAGLSLGAGLQYRVQSFRIVFDYAYVDYGPLKESSQFGLRLGF